MSKTDIGILIALTAMLTAVLTFGFGLVIALLLAPREQRRPRATLAKERLHDMVSALSEEEAVMAAAFIEQRRNDAFRRALSIAVDRDAATEEAA